MPRLPSSRAAAIAAAALVLLSACSADVVDGHGATGRSPAPSSAPGSPRPSAGGGTGPTSVDFGPCGNGVDLGTGSVPSHFEVTCARIKVPLDYDRPGGGQLAVALVRIHDSDADNTQPLLMNPGGPGGSGVQFAVNIAAALPSAVTGHYDLVGFDPRGVGSSAPIRCESDAQKDRLNAASPDVRTPSGFAEAKEMAQSVAEACSAKYGDALAEYDTVSTAKDMDRIRAALGDDQLDYLGFSYGTELGAQYAHLFPQRVGAMVLDGAVDPLTDDITSFADQLEGFEQSFDQFAEWCTSHDPCTTLGNPRQVVYDLLDQAGRAPIPSSAPGETRKATSSIVDLGVLSALYTQAYWPVLTEALIAARDGNSAGLFQLADAYNERTDGHYTNIADSNLAISCNDSAPGPADATIRATARLWVRRFPMFGLWSAASLFACQQWQPHRTPPPVPKADDSAHPILVVGNLHDPATPYQGAKDLTRTLGHAALLTWDGEGHTSYLQGSRCIDAAVNAYLVDGTLPSSGTTCPR